MINNNDIAIIRQLAAQVAEISALPVQEEKRLLWRKLNALRPDRPMVMIDQVCWHEINVAQNPEPRVDSQEDEAVGTFFDGLEEQLDRLRPARLLAQ